MPSASSFLTHANNFTSAVSGGVDPRTGVFNIRIRLGALVGNRGLGPSLPLVLSYSPMTSTDVGFGRGVSMGLTTYDADDRLLTISTGEQYRVEETDKKVVLLQSKLDIVHVDRKPAENAYRIAHKSGGVEILTGPGNAFSLKVPTVLLTPTGHRLGLEWDFASGPQPRLVAVKDEEEPEPLLSVTYAGESRTTLRVLPGRPEGYDVDLRLREGLLASVHHFALGRDKPLVWDFAHTQLGEQGEWGSWITGATMPGGLTETAHYQNAGHRFPVTAGLPPLPRVHRFVQVPGCGQPLVEASYEYTDTNFVGGHSDVDWNGDCDNLYEVLTDYSYGSTESRTCAGRTTRTTRRYNNFHLQILERQQQNHCSHTVETQYYAIAGKPFDEQLAQFQLPSKKTVTWTDSGSTLATSSQEVTETAFDGAGNPKSQTDPDGTYTEWTYYPPGGAGSDCPPEPNGFTRLLKSATRTPPATHVDAHPPVHTTTFFYEAHQMTSDPWVSTAVLKSREQTGVKDQQAGSVRIMRSQTFAYDTSEAGEFGRLTNLTTIDDPDEANSDANQNVETFTYSLKDDTLVQDRVVTVPGPLVLKSRQICSRFTGRPRSTTDPQGNSDTTTYDKLGRLLTHTANPGTPYEAVTSWTYETGGSVPFVTTSTDVMGNQIRESYDGAGRLTLRERKDIDDDQGDCAKPGNGKWYTVFTQHHDEQGRPASTTTIDHSRGANGGEIKLTRTLAYDDWGQLSAVAHADGSGQLTLHDPVSRTTTTHLLGDGKPLPGRTVTTYDMRGAPVSIVRLGPNDLSEHTPKRTFEHDGLGRLRSETDEAGHTTTYDYDVHDRLMRTTLPDGTQVMRNYAPFSARGLPTKLTVDGKTYGTQEFDGLGRRTSATTGGRTWSWTYEKACDPLPSTCTTPYLKEQDKPLHTRTYQYIPQLANALTRMQAGDLTQEYTHHPVTGALTTAQEIRRAATGSGEQSTDSVTLTLAHYPSGRLCSTTTRLHGYPDTTTSTTYTVDGLEQSRTGVDGSAQETTWDAFGRVLAVTDRAARATLRYDSAGRIIGWTTEDRQSKNTLTTALVLDELGHETTRTLTDSQGTTWTLTQTWQPGDLLKSRSLTRGTASLREETFEYTCRNQLTKYTCSGSAAPRDEQGRQISRQTFTYDAYGNITTCHTWLADGSDTTSTYLFGNPDDPCQLTGIDLGKPKAEIKLHYDEAGRLSMDDSGRALAYDVLGRLTTVTAAGTAFTYRYGPNNRLLIQKTGDATSILSYHRDKLASVTDGDRHTRLIRLGQACVAERREAPSPSTRLLGSDGKQSVLTATGNALPADEYAYTPYGHRKAGATDSILGYNGERTDPATGWYHLGNGYRAYSPALMRFTTPDSFSPFGPGGINPYVYCLGDPINRTDPTGHLSWKAWLGIGLGVLAVASAVWTGGLSVGAATGAMAILTAVNVTAGVTGIVSGALEDTAPKASSVLGWISLGTGLIGLGGAVASASAGGLSRLGGLARSEAWTWRGELGRCLGRAGTESGAALEPSASTSAANTVPIVHIPDTAQYIKSATLEPYVIEETGRSVYMSQYTIKAEKQVQSTLGRLLSEGRKVNLIAGAHGRAGGWFVSAPEEAVESARESVSGMISKGGFAADSVKVYNIRRLIHENILKDVLMADRDTVVGICWGRNNEAVRTALGLEPAESYVPWGPNEWPPGMR
ncbi:RHS repeat-associated core domain-containing protein [Kitasatospora purpeofusca]|uniref:RHS repeat-associated core domain-containing protein n=1 Tax=Kitasatospora purpeofusca TaxID=67352 RepID=UPI0035DE2CD8